MCISAFVVQFDRFGAWDLTRIAENSAARARMARADGLPIFNARMGEGCCRVVVRGGGGGLRNLAGAAD